MAKRDTPSGRHMKRQVMQHLESDVEEAKEHMKEDEHLHKKLKKSMKCPKEAKNG